MFSVRRSFAWMALSQGSLFVMQFGTTLVVARLLTPYEMGVFAIAVSIVGLLSTLRALGLSSYIVRAANLNASLLSSVFTINVALAALLSIIIGGLSVLGGALLNEPGVQHLLQVMAILPLLSIFEFLPMANMERRGEFRTIALVNIAKSIFSNIILVTMVLAGFSYMSLAYGQVASAVMGVVSASIAGRRYVSVRFGIADWRNIIKYGLQMLAISGIDTITSRISELLLARFLGLGALGLYSRASSLNGLLWDNIHVLIARVVFVDFAEQRRQGKSLHHSYLRIVKTVTALLWPAFIGLAIISGPLILTLYGKNWVSAAVPLSLLSISAAVLVSITMTWEVFVICQETATQARFEFIRTGVGLAFFAAGCVFGLVGVATAKIGEAIFAVILYRPHLERMTNTCLQDFIPIYIQSATLTVIAVLPVMLVMIINEWSPNTPMLAIFAAILVGMGSWLIGLRVFRHHLLDEILQPISLFFIAMRASRVRKS